MSTEAKVLSAVFSECKKAFPQLDLTSFYFQKTSPYRPGKRGQFSIVLEREVSSL